MKEQQAKTVEKYVYFAFKMKKNLFFSVNMYIELFFFKIELNYLFIYMFMYF